MFRARIEPMFKKYINYIEDNPKGYWFKAKLYGGDGYQQNGKAGALLSYISLSFWPSYSREKLI